MDDLKTDKQVVALIDEIKHRLKAGQPYSLLRSDFCIALNQLIEKHGLDWDPHSYARLPEKPLIKWQSWEYVGIEVFLWVDDLPEHVNPLTDLPTIKERDGIKEGDLLIVGSVFGWTKARAGALLADGSINAKSTAGSMLCFLEFAKDDRKCWICSGSGNLAAIEKLELK